MASKLRDPLLDRKVRINADATTASGKPHGHAGQDGLVVKKNSGGQYQIVCGDTIVTVPLDSFTILPLETAQRDAPGAAQPAAASLHGEQSVLPITAIVPGRNTRTRFDEEWLLELAANIKAFGIMQPILVRKLPGERLQDTFETAATRHATHEIVAGERRWRASKMAGMREMPVLVRNLTDAEALVLQLVENIQREDLHPLEEAHGLDRLMHEQGYTVEMVAEAINKSTSYVYDSVRLVGLCPEAQTALNDGKLTRSTALLVAQRPTPALQAQFTARVLAGPGGEPMSYREAKDLAQRVYMTKLSTAPFNLADATLVPKAGSCTACPKRTGANPGLWDKTGPDTCTDTGCFNEKKEAYSDALRAAASKRGQKIITGRAAREIMPTENAAPAGYILLDKPRNDVAAVDDSMRTVLGKDVPASKIVLIESPSGAMVEAVPTRAAGMVLQDRAAKGGKPKPVSESDLKAELQRAYEQRWRDDALEAVMAALEKITHPVSLPAPMWKHLVTMETYDAKREHMGRVLGLPANFGTEDVNTALNTISSSNGPMMTLKLIAAVEVGQPGALGEEAEPTPLLDSAAAYAGVDLDAIRLAVQEEMKNEAATRAAQSGAVDQARPALKPGAKGKPAKPKASKIEAAASIAAALQQVEAQIATEPQETWDEAP